MSQLSDDQLLQRYVRQGSREAFDELARRHGHVVLSACRRELPDTAMAEDAAQATFLLLARKAKSLKGDGSLAGWLFKSAVLVCRTMRREEERRRERERKAAEGRERMMASTRESAWTDIEPMLNDAISELRPVDREAVVLRYLEGLRLAEVGERTGSSEDAARMRVSRGLSRLHQLLRRKGASLSVLALERELDTHIAADPIRTVLQIKTGGVAASVAKGVALQMTVVAITKLSLGLVGATASLVAFSAFTPSGTVPDAIAEPSRTLVWAVVGQTPPYRAPAGMAGRWQRTAAEWDGLDQTPTLTGTSYWLLGAAGSWEGGYQDRASKGGEKGTFRTSGNRFDFTTGTGSGARKYLGIYKLDGDSLTVAYAKPGKPRPTSLKTEQGWKDEVMVETFRRAGPAR